MNIRYPIYEGVYRILTYQETYALTPVTYKLLTPETDSLFQMDDYPERLSRWLVCFTGYIDDNF